MVWFLNKGHREECVRMRCPGSTRAPWKKFLEEKRLGQRLERNEGIRIGRVEGARAAYGRTGVNKVKYGKDGWRGVTGEEMEWGRAEMAARAWMPGGAVWI